MKRGMLHVSKELALPLDAATQTFAFLAKRRVGKTYAASVLAEEMHEHGLPWVALDPTGAWWGLRAGADGRAKGLPVVIVGGAHGDVPLERGAGAVIADLVVDHPGWYVLDFSLTESGAAACQFAADFADRLYRAKARQTAPLHVFVDEADQFIPQRPQPGEQRMLGAWEALVRRGGVRGLGVSLITQRAAVLNKNVLTQVECLFILQTTGPQDRAAVLDWAKGHGTREQVEQLDASMASLGRGRAWVWSPSWLDIFQQVTIRERRTFNSSGTPEVGSRRLTHPAFAPVDLEALKGRIASTIEQAKANDPKLLKARIAELERLLAKMPEPKVERVEVSVLTDADRELLQVVVDTVKPAAESFMRDFGLLRDRVVPALERAAKPAATPYRFPEDVRLGTPRVIAPGESRVSAEVERHYGAGVIVALRNGPARKVAAAPANGLSGPMQRILDELSTLEAMGLHDVERAQLALFCGYTNARSGGFTEPLGALNEQGLVRYPAPGRVALEDAGRRVARRSDRPKTSAALQAMVLEKLDGPPGRILHVLLEASPHDVARDALGKQLGYENPRSGGFTEPLGRLKALGLVDYPSPGRVRASDLLFLD